MKKLIGHVRAAVEKYQMIEEGDRIAVGVSGGKGIPSSSLCPGGTFPLLPQALHDNSHHGGALFWM